jgi:hypothetical protein
MDLDSLVTSIASLPSGELLVATLSGLERRDAAGTKVLASRATASPVFGLSPKGPLYLADGPKVVTLDPSSLASVGSVPFPSARGPGGKLRQLAVSTDGSALAGVTVNGTVHVRRLDGSAQETHPGSGERCENLGFVGPDTFAYVLGNTFAEVRTICAETTRASSSESRMACSR